MRPVLCLAYMIFMCVFAVIVHTSEDTMVLQQANMQNYHMLENIRKKLITNNDDYDIAANGTLDIKGIRKIKGINQSKRISETKRIYETRINETKTINRDKEISDDDDKEIDKARGIFEAEDIARNRKSFAQRDLFFNGEDMKSKEHATSNTQQQSWFGKVTEPKRIDHKIEGPTFDIESGTWFKEIEEAVYSDENKKSSKEKKEPHLFVEFLDKALDSEKTQLINEQDVVSKKEKEEKLFDAYLKKVKDKDTDEAEVINGHSTNSKEIEEAKFYGGEKKDLTIKDKKMTNSGQSLDPKEMEEARFLDMLKKGYKNKKEVKYLEFKAPRSTSAENVETFTTQEPVLKAVNAYLDKTNEKFIALIGAVNVSDGRQNRKVAEKNLKPINRLLNKELDSQTDFNAASPVFVANFYPISAHVNKKIHYKAERSARDGVTKNDVDGASEDIVFKDDILPMMKVKLLNEHLGL